MPNEIQFVLYNIDKEDVNVKVAIKDDTIWVTQRGMAELFDCSADNISLHLKNIYQDGELQESATAEDFSVVQNEGSRQVSRNLKFYNLDAIISVGYRVNSRRATQFRIWATNVLREFIQKGFVLDDDRLKQGESVFGKDYFRELLERVRSIRASERRIWQQITDIFAECSIDYDKNSPRHVRILRHRAKQIPLCHYGTNGGGNYLRQSRQQKRPYGTYDVEKLPRRKNFEIRRNHSQKLSRRKADTQAGKNCVRFFRLCGRFNRRRTHLYNAAICRIHK